jgi:GDP-L-fucose synthase
MIIISYYGIFMKSSDIIFVAGHNGMVGSAILRALKHNGFNNIVLATRSELNLLKKREVESFFQNKKPDYVFLAAAKVGGIRANIQYPVEFLYENLEIQNNILYSCNLYKVKKVVFLGSSCIYPANCPQPMKEEYLMTGPLEPTNEGYALAKIAGLKLAQYYTQEYGLNCLCPMPCNLYGNNDSFDPINSHVLSALVKKFVDAVEEKQENVTIWGTGTARREFMHVDDLADALLFLVEHWTVPDIINVGTGTDISIFNLAHLIAKKVNYYGTINWDSSMPDGMKQKCLDVSKLQSLGYKHKISLERGIEDVIKEYLIFKENKH